MHFKHVAFFICVFIAVCYGEVDDDIKNIQNKFDGITNNLNITNIPKMEEAEEIFKKKCLKEANEDAYYDVMRAKDDFTKCLEDLINFETLKNEIEEAKPTGDLDIVFKKYCKKSPILKTCVSNFTRTIEPCLNEKEKANKKIVLNVTESLTNFICYKEGDRIALFIAEGGPECLMDKQEAVEQCVNKTMSKYIPKESLSLDNLPELLIKTEQCDDMNKLQDCIVKELETCKEPTPANIAESLFKFIKQVTPCGKKAVAAARESPPQNKPVESSPQNKSVKNSATSIMLSSLLLLTTALYIM